MSGTGPGESASTEQASSESASTEPASTRRIGAAARLLGGDPGDVERVLERLDDDQLSNLGEVARQIQRRRAIADGDLDAVIAHGFEVGFGRDDLAVLPWAEGRLIVCPGGLVGAARGGHRCRFVSVDDVWIWDSAELVREDKRSTAGRRDGFRAVAVLPLIDGLGLDVVTGRARGGQHSVEHVVSIEVRRGELVEVAQRSVTPAGMQ